MTSYLYLGNFDNFRCKMKQNGPIGVRMSPVAVEKQQGTEYFQISYVDEYT